MEKQLLEFKEKYESEKEMEERKSNRLSRVRISLFLVFFLSVILYINQPSIWIIVILWVVAIAFVFTIIYHNQVNKKKQKYEIYIDLIEKYEMRRTEEWKSIKSEEIEVEDSALLDLGIFGKNSLFQFLNFTCSLGGKSRLVDTLSLKEVTEKNIVDTQRAVEELKENFEYSLLIQEKLLHVKDIDKIDFKKYFYLFEKKEKSRKLETVISIFFSCLTILIFLLSCFQILPPVYFIGLFLFQLAASYFYSMIYREEFDTITKCARSYSSLKEVYQYIDSISFHSKKKQFLQGQIRKGNNTILKLYKISSLNAYRFNFITNILLNTFFSLNFLILYRYERLLETESETFKKSISALEEFEVLISLATIGIVKEEVTFPTISKNITLDLKSIKHPLLMESDCIFNDFKCNQDIQIITGSNMSGKTSFMKTIGINLVLAYSGTYVNATSFSCAIMKIFTSINVKDDISKGISTFYGELQRIKNVLDFSKNNSLPMVIFIDEIFKGTNYNDRILGAKEVLNKLSDLSCIAFLTTHDFELCEVNNKKIHNYHFEENYKQNRISFDYKIKKGQCKTTNAKYLMKQIGIID